jgi:hypothetical protein
MVIIWGSVNAGKVDEVPGGMFHVVTRFGHLYYIPLIPMGSFIVLEKMSDGSFNGAPIPMSWKSILTGWLRGGSIVAMIGALVGTFLLAMDKNALPIVRALPLLIFLVAGAALFASYKLKLFTEASYERAIELARVVGLNETGLLMLEVTYGRMNAAQADAELAKLEEKAARQAQEPMLAQVLD